LAELKSVENVKNRYQVKSDDDAPKSKSSDEKIVEVKAGTLKDRLGAYQQVAESSDKKASQTEDRLAEIRGATGIKDRLGAYNQNLEPTDPLPKPVVDSPQLEAIRKTSSVKKGRDSWSKVEENPTTIASDPQAVAERIAEAKVGVSIKDRLNVWTEKQNEPENVGPRKEPIKIDYGF